MISNYWFVVGMNYSHPNNYSKGKNNGDKVLVPDKSNPRPPYLAEGMNKRTCPFLMSIDISLLTTS